MVPIAHDPTRVKLIFDIKKKYADDLCPHFKAAILDPFSDIDVDYLSQLADHRRVRKCKENMDLSVKKCDVPGKCPRDELQKTVMSYAYSLLEDSLNTTVSGPDDDLSYTPGSSPSSWYKRKGFKTKKDVLLYDDTFPERVFSTDHIPMCDYNEKDELLPLSSIMEDNKIRGTFNPMFDFVMKQKLLFGRQDENLKKNSSKASSWIKYGYSKEYGGFNRLGKQLEQFEFIDEGDVKGYDRSIFLEPVYDLRVKGLSYPSEYFPMLVYVIIYTIFAIFVSFTGDVLMRLAGNISGSACTTSDNSIAHLIISLRLILNLYRYKNHPIPSLSDICKNHHFLIYSDDCLSGHNLSVIGATMEDYLYIKTLTYKEFGLELKASQQVNSYVKNKKLSDKHSFLGSFFYFDDFYRAYIPYPRAGKIASSIVYRWSGLTRDDFLPKLISMYVLASAIPKLQCEIKKIIEFAFEHVKSNHPDIELYRELYARGQKSSRFWFGWLLGREASFSFFYSQCYFKIFYGRRMEIKNLIVTLSLTSMTEKAEKKIKLLTERVGTSEEGRLWLEQCLDPFTDTPKRPVGFPDLIVGKSVVQVVKQSSTLDMGSLGAGDVHIFMDNLDTRVQVYKNNRYVEASQQRGQTWSATAVGGISNYTRGGLVVRHGTGTSPTITTTGTVNTAGVSLPSSYIDSGRTRVIAKGFEIINVTPILNRGGSITVYRDTTSSGYRPSGAGSVKNSVTPTYSLNLPVYPLAKIPESQAEAVLIPGAKQWDASEGCYCVCTMNRQENNPGDEAPFILLSHDSSNSNADDYLNVVGSGNIPVTTQTKDIGGGLFAPVPQMVSPFFASGAWLGGLPVETKLQVNAVWIIERFVDQSNPDLVVLSQPSPFYDVVALELYSRMAHRLKAGVPVEENDSGDWIKDVADVLQDFGVPGMPLVKGGVDLYQKISGVDSKHDKKKNEHEKEMAEVRKEINELKALLAGVHHRMNLPDTTRPQMQAQRAPLRAIKSIQSKAPVKK